MSVAFWVGEFCVVVGGKCRVSRVVGGGIGGGKGVEAEALMPTRRL